MVVLVTGASSGLGKYTAEEFVKKGHTVYGSSRKPIDTKNGVHMLQLDVWEDTSCKAAVEHIVEREGRLDILVNNAGMGIAGPLEFTSDSEAKLQFETNFFGVLRMSRAVLPCMRAQKQGKILNVSSVAAAIPIPFQSMYSAGKAAVESISQALHMEVSPYGIQVASIEFGDMKTGFTGSRRITEAAKQDAQTERIYSETFQKSLGIMEQDEQNGPEPDAAAKLIVKMAEKNRIKPVKICGLKYQLIAVLRRVLPIRFTNWLIQKVYT